MFTEPFIFFVRFVFSLPLTVTYKPREHKRTTYNWSHGSSILHSQRSVLRTTLWHVIFWDAGFKAREALWLYQGDTNIPAAKFLFLDGILVTVRFYCIVHWRCILNKDISDLLPSRYVGFWAKHCQLPLCKHNLYTEYKRRKTNNKNNKQTYKSYEGHSAGIDISALSQELDQLFMKRLINSTYPRVQVFFEMQGSISVWCCVQSYSLNHESLLVKVLFHKAPLVVESLYDSHTESFHTRAFS